jgi:hypothetical protein
MMPGSNPTHPLQQVLRAKIVLTVAVWCVPLLLFPESLLLRMGFPVPEPELFLRLLGMAYGALVVGYGFGLRSAKQGQYPAGTVWVGIVSNGGACLILTVAAVSGSWVAWGDVARWVMWGSLVGTGAITAGLVVFGPLRQRSGLGGGGRKR